MLGCGGRRPEHSIGTMGGDSAAMPSVRGLKPPALCSPV